jgi:probable phosphoglycerate mutase
MKRVYFVRHGETEGNLNRFFQFPDTPLSDAGHKGAQAVAQRFKNVEVDLLVASPFKRTQQTAQYISDVLQLPIETKDEFHERWMATTVRGKLLDSAEGKAYRSTYLDNFFNPDCTLDGFETFSEVLQRMRSGVGFLEESDRQNIVVVSHGNFLVSLGAYLLLNKSDNLESNAMVTKSLARMSNVGITEFTFEDDTWKLFTWNDHAHFAE